MKIKFSTGYKPQNRRKFLLYKEHAIGMYFPPPDNIILIHPKIKFYPLLCISVIIHEMIHWFIIKKVYSDWKKISYKKMNYYNNLLDKLDVYI